MNYQSYKKGFTLVELLVVITIIGILSSVVLVSLNSARGKARDTKRVADIRQIALALEFCYDQNQRYISPSDFPVPSAAFICGDTTIISNMPSDPTTGESYSYGVDSAGNPQRYVLATILEQETNSALSGDIDGSIYGIDCEDPVYCLQH